MDSMNNLQRSLPASATRRNAVLTPFREAACSLTAFFKTASAEIDIAYNDGSRSALEQLLAAMDKENIGLQEGEGWRVRQLVMGIYDGLRPEATTGDAGEDLPNGKEVEHSATIQSSPIALGERKTSDDAEASSPEQKDEKRRGRSASSEQMPSGEKMPLPPMDFTFTAAHPSALFASRKTPASPSDATRTPPLRPMALDWNTSGLNIFAPAATTKQHASLGPAAGIKRRSKSPSDSSEDSAPPTPKRARKHASDEQQSSRTP